jgi:hypothetical protein
MSTRRRQRRTRLKPGGMTPSERWALVFGDDVGMPRGEPWPFRNDEEALACWRRHRDVLMAERSPRCAPCGLWLYEPESFASLEAIRALRLDREALHRGRCEFESLASFHRRHGRIEQAEQFEERARRVREAIAEGAA